MLVATALFASTFAHETPRLARVDAVRVRDALDALEEQRAAALGALTVGVREALRAASTGASAVLSIAARAIGVRIAGIETQAVRATIPELARRGVEALRARAARRVAER